MSTPRTAIARKIFTSIKWTIIQGLIIALALSVGTAYAQTAPTIRAVERLTVFDSKGKKVGPVLGFSALFGRGLSVPVVALNVDGRLVLPGVTTNQLIYGIGSVEIHDLYFESPHCTGTPFMSQGTFNPTPIQGIETSFFLGLKVYLQDGPYRQISVRSYFALTTQQCYAGNFDTNGIPVRFLVDLGSHFEPPFSVR